MTTSLNDGTGICSSLIVTLITLVSIDGSLVEPNLILIIIKKGEWYRVNFQCSKNLSWCVLTSKTVNLAKELGLENCIQGHDLKGFFSTYLKLFCVIQ